jgi:acetylglutamate kinase
MSADQSAGPSSIGGGGQPGPIGVAITTTSPESTVRAEVAQGKAAVLREALPWITRFHGQTVVIKYGGNAMIDVELQRSFAADVALLHFVGLRPVIVHGGGPQISDLARERGVESRFVGGLRVTDEAMIEVVHDALVGVVNPEVVALVEAAGAPATGVIGSDGPVLTCTTARGPDGEDIGLVGEVSAVDVAALEAVLAEGRVPVLATLGRDAQGREHNVNADTAAGAVAAALGASKLVVLTDVPGLYHRFGDPDHERLISELTVGELEAMVDSDELSDGMRPKVAAVLAALQGGTPQAHILDGRVQHAVLIEIFTDEGIGTMVRAVASDDRMQDGTVTPVPGGRSS